MRENSRADQNNTASETARARLHRVAIGSMESGPDASTTRGASHNNSSTPNSFEATQRVEDLMGVERAVPR
jgi:hypothetical protein